MDEANKNRYKELFMSSFALSFTLVMKFWNDYKLLKEFYGGANGNEA